MGAFAPNVIGYALWVPSGIFAAECGFYLTENGKTAGFLAEELEGSTLYKTREEAESAALLMATERPAMIGKIEVRPVIAGYAIKGQVRTVMKHYHPHLMSPASRDMPSVTVQGYFGGNGDFHETLEEAPKFRSKEQAETVAFNMTLKNHDLIGTLEVVEIRLAVPQG